MSWKSKRLPLPHLGSGRFKRGAATFQPRYLDDLDSDLAEEIQLLLAARGYERLAAAVLDLRLIQARAAADPESLSFRTVSRLNTARVRGHGRETLILRTEPLLSVEVVRDRIVAINVSGRPRLMATLAPATPSPPDETLTDRTHHA